MIRLCIRNTCGETIEIECPKGKREATEKISMMVRDQGFYYRSKVLNTTTRGLQDSHEVWMPYHCVKDIVLQEEKSNADPR